MDDFDAFDDEDRGGAGLPAFLRDLQGIPRRRWPWMVAGLAVGLAATAVAVALWKPTYEAVASLMMSRQQVPEDFVRTTVEDDLFSRLNAMVGEVMSRDKLVALIDELGLYGEQRDRLSRTELAARMRANIEIVPTETIGRTSRRDRPTAQVFTISFTGKDRHEVAEVANRLAGLFLEASLKTRMEHAISISRFLRAELERTEETLKAETRAVANFREEHRGELPEELESNLRSLERLQGQAATLATQIAESETRLALIAAGDEDPNSPLVRLSRLQEQLDHQLAVNTAEHPTVRSLQRQVDALRSQIESGQTESNTSATRDALVRRASLGLDQLRQQKADIEARMTDIEARVARTPQNSEELASLEEKAAVTNEKYLEFLRKVNEAEMARNLEAAQQGARVSIMDQAQTPRRPSIPRLYVLAAGLLASLGLPLVLGVLAEALDPVMVDAQQTEHLAGVPVLGAVPRIG